MDTTNKIKLTVQGVGYPVPAMQGSEQAGSPSSKPTYRSGEVVTPLATSSSTSTEARTPIGEASDSPAVPANPFAKSKRLERSPKKVVPSTTIATPSRTIDENSAVQECLKVLKQHIDELNSYVKDRHNVHKDIKRRALEIKEAWLDLSSKIAPGIKVTPTETAEKETQTKNVFKLNPLKGTPKSGPDVRTPKRRMENPDQPTGRSPKRKKNKAENLASCKSPIATPASATTEPEPTAKGEWMTVTKHVNDKKKFKDKKSRPRKTKPDAVVVGLTGGESYAAILKQVKSDPRLKDVGENITRIRRTKKGELLLELKRNSSINSSSCKRKMEESLHDLATIRALTHDVNVEIRDLDEITTIEEVQEAIKTSSNLEASNISLRKARDGTQIAIFSLPLAEAQPFLRVGKIKIGWSICRVREKFTPKKCYRCLGFGHLAFSCKEPDRSKMCRRCGQEGHFAKNCKKPFKCMLCSREDLPPANHATGGTSCPAYRRALPNHRREVNTD